MLFRMAAITISAFRIVLAPDWVPTTHVNTSLSRSAACLVHAAHLRLGERRHGPDKPQRGAHHYDSASYHFFRGLGMEYSSSLVTSVRREIPSLSAARV